MGLKFGGGFERRTKKYENYKMVLNILFGEEIELGI